MRVFAISGQ